VSVKFSRCLNCVIFKTEIKFTVQLISHAFVLNRFKSDLNDASRVFLVKIWSICLNCTYGLTLFFYEILR